MLRFNATDRTCIEYFFPIGDKGAHEQRERFLHPPSPSLCIFSTHQISIAPQFFKAWRPAIWGITNASLLVKCMQFQQIPSPVPLFLLSSNEYARSGKFTAPVIAAQQDFSGRARERRAVRQPFELFKVVVGNVDFSSKLYPVACTFSAPRCDARPVASNAIAVYPFFKSIRTCIQRQQA